MNIRIKRAYERSRRGRRPPIPWTGCAPGHSKEKRESTSGLKDLAPSNELRSWYGHEPEKWPDQVAGFAWLTATRAGERAARTCPLRGQSPWSTAQRAAAEQTPGSEEYLEDRAYAPLPLLVRCPDTARHTALFHTFPCPPSRPAERNFRAPAWRRSVQGAKLRHQEITHYYSLGTRIFCVLYLLSTYSEEEDTGDGKRWTYLPSAESVWPYKLERCFCRHGHHAGRMLTLHHAGSGGGIRTIDPATEENPSGGLGIGTLSGGLSAVSFAYFAGGWVSSRVAGLQRVFDGALHGLVTWSLVPAHHVMLTNTVGFVLGGAFGLVENVVSIQRQAAGP